MENYFFLLSQEFDLQIKQAKEVIKNHNPSLGTINEEILRKFLKDHLPKWVDVAQGYYFIYVCAIIMPIVILILRLK